MSWASLAIGFNEGFRGAEERLQGQRAKNVEALQQFMQLNPYASMEDFQKFRDSVVGNSLSLGQAMPDTLLSSLAQQAEQRRRDDELARQLSQLEADSKRREYIEGIASQYYGASGSDAEVSDKIRESLPDALREEYDRRYAPSLGERRQRYREEQAINDFKQWREFTGGNFLTLSPDDPIVQNLPAQQRQAVIGEIMRAKDEEARRVDQDQAGKNEAAFAHFWQDPRVTQILGNTTLSIDEKLERLEPIMKDAERLKLGTIDRAAVASRIEILIPGTIQERRAASGQDFIERERTQLEDQIKSTQATLEDEALVGEIKARYGDDEAASIIQAMRAIGREYGYLSPTAIQAAVEEAYEQNQGASSTTLIEAAVDSLTAMASTALGLREGSPLPTASEYIGSRSGGTIIYGNESFDFNQLRTDLSEMRVTLRDMASKYARGFIMRDQYRAALAGARMYAQELEQKIAQAHRMAGQGMVYAPTSELMAELTTVLQLLAQAETQASVFERSFGVTPNTVSRQPMPRNRNAPTPPTTEVPGALPVVP